MSGVEAEAPRYVESGLPPVSLVTASLSGEMQERLQILQNGYAEQFGSGHLILPGHDELYATFAEVIVPDTKETDTSVLSRVEEARPHIMQAIKQLVQNNTSEPFHIPATYEGITARQDKIKVRAPDTNGMRLWHRFFESVLKTPMDRPTPNAINVTPVFLKREVNRRTAKAFTDKNVAPYFRPVDSPVTSLQLREFSLKTRRLEVVEEFPVLKK